jgi:hypothetical protein
VNRNGALFQQIFSLRFKRLLNTGGFRVLLTGSFDNFYSFSLREYYRPFQSTRVKIAVALLQPFDLAPDLANCRGNSKHSSLK